MNDYRPMQDFPWMHGCGGCKSRWGGHATAHCSGCHLTFTGLTAFDKHRKHYKCVNPQQAGLVLSSRAYPCWGVPGERPFGKDEENVD